MNKKIIIFMSIIALIILFLIALFLFGSGSAKPVKKKHVENNEIEVSIEVVDEFEKTEPVKEELNNRIEEQKIEEIKEPAPVKEELNNRTEEQKIEEIKEPAPTQQDDNSTNKQENYNGVLPSISANYRKYLGFKRYAWEVSKRGGAFVVMGDNSKKIYKINFNSKTLNKITIEDLKKSNFSSRSRIITDEPALDHYRNLAKKRYNLSNPEVILLVPNKYEKYIASLIVSSDISMKNISSFKGYYRTIGNDFLLTLNRAVYTTGEIKNIDININL